jgi:FkbM family methyltransferase
VKLLTRLRPYARLFTTVSAHDAHLPYNWNWQRRWDAAIGFLSQNPIVLMDIGARGGPPPELDSLQPYVRRVGFEPDPDEYRRLKESGRGIFFPYVVASSDGKEVLRLYRDRGCSSVLSLSRRYQRLWTGELAVDGTVELDAITVDSFLAGRGDLAPDFLKLDTEGSELSILHGAERALSTIGLVEVEVGFLPIYEGQPLISDVAQFMADHGFELLYLNRNFLSRRQVYDGPSRGQLEFADALFGKREDKLEHFSVEQRAKYAILLCQYGHLDIAWQLFDAEPELERLVPSLRSVFRRHANPISRATMMQIDKLLAVLLHMRRHNQRGADSDRSWPIG